MPDRKGERRSSTEIARWKEWTREVLEARKDGTCFPTRLTSVPVTSPDGTQHIITLSENITEQKLAERTLQESEERYRSLVESTDDSIYLVDRDCRYLFVNRKHLLRLGLSEAAYMGRPYEDFHSEEESNWFRRMVERVCEAGESIHIEHQGSPDGRTFLLTFSPVLAAGGEVTSVNVISKNITELKRLEEDLRSLTLSDELTGVYNRRGFFALAGQQTEVAHRHRKKVCLLYVDVDGLKGVNDTLGHPAGDRLLADTARLLRKIFRRSDVIARMGGDEFVVLSVQEPAESDDGIAHRLMENLAAFNSERHSEPALSLSVGTATCEADDPCRIEELLSLADRAMYRNKNRR
jgi:diguanylate cyclase (GGDEF)-like protein/PAS domain S-box-containing protein